MENSFSFEPRFKDYNIISTNQLDIPQRRKNAFKFDKTPEETIGKGMRYMFSKLF